MTTLFEVPQAREPDATAREQALDVERSWIVEAPAGSGKTGLLIQRYLCLLAHSSVTEPEQVLAITFTKAATEEIRARVLRELQQAEGGFEPRSHFEQRTQSMAKAVLARDHSLGWRLLDEPRRLRVRTIDAVCAEIARSLPILCGGNSALTPVEEPASLYHEAAQRTWLHLGGEDKGLSNALKLVLLHRDADLQASSTLVAEMLAEREQWGSLVPLKNEDLDEYALNARVREQLDETLKEVICEALGRLSLAFPEQTLRRLASLAHGLSSRAGYNNQPSPLAVCRELRNSPNSAVEHLDYWRAFMHLLIAPSTRSWRKSFNKNHLGFELAGKDKALLEEIALEVQGHPEILGLLNEIASLPPARFPAEQWPLTKALFRILRQALAELQVVFSETGLCDFIEPALLARYALQQQSATSSPDTLIGTQLMHLLIDEMQDTSVRQYELIERLTEGWAESQRTVFLVGDPKQSIYLFRQARVERFIKTMRSGRLGMLSIGVLQLTANFRSQAGLVKAFNQDFSKIFTPTTTRPDEVKYVQAVPTRKLTSASAGDQGSVWHLTVLPLGDPDAARIARAQLRQNARDIRSTIERWRALPLPPGRSTPWRIAVLVQSRQNLANVLPELRRDPPIPFRALSIDTLDTRREILDMLALTRALLHPADRTAWLAVLRAPWCGLTLADLHVLTGQDDEQYLGRTIMTLIATRGSEVSADGIMRLERVWPVLASALEAMGTIRIPECVERTWRSLGGHLFLNNTEYKNVETYLDLLRTIDQEKGQIRLSEVLRRIERLYATSATAADAVDLVTIHGAKGLEWDLVLVPELERRARVSAPRMFEWEELPNGRVVLAPISARGEDASALHRWVRSVRSRRDAAERKRLFYVACTRAREELHLFGIAASRSDEGVTPNAGSLLQAAWPAAEDRIPAKTRSEVLHLPSHGVIVNIAAGEDNTETTPSARPTLLQRLPWGVRPFASLLKPESHQNERDVDTTWLLRSRGSFASRCLGITVHTFLEEAGNKIRLGSNVSTILVDLPAWEPRIRAVLRTHGLPPFTVEQQLRTVSKALQMTLQNATGQWLLQAHPEARNEFALTPGGERTRHYRIDRMFRAGASPNESGDKYLWLIDYKTAHYPGSIQSKVAVEEFFKREQERHEPQLMTYAGLMNEAETRLGLWYPLMSRLVWWVAGEFKYQTLSEITHQDGPRDIPTDRLALT